MPKVGRNDPCPCGSGKKYKQCHLPIEEAAAATQRLLRQAQDTLMPRLIEAAQGLPAEMPAALERFWNGKYTADQLSELDTLEDRGADRFLTWFVFDYALDDGRTLLERLASGEGTLELSDDEARLLHAWAPVRLRPYVVDEALKGQHVQLRDLLDGRVVVVEDHAASRRVEAAEVVVAHLVPVGSELFFAGAAAHLTADTAEKLKEYADLHLEAFARDHPGADWVALLRARSDVLNHFVMALPVAAPDPSMLDEIVQQTRMSLQLAGETIGIIRRPEEEQELASPDEEPPA